MQWSKLVPELIVSDFDRSLRFYAEVLGFKVAYTRSDPAFAYLDQQGAQIMLEQRTEEVWLTGALERPFGRGINLQIELDDIGPLYEKLTAMRYPFFRDVAVHWYSTGATETGVREFLIQDPDGYLLRFSQDLGERTTQ